MSIISKDFTKILDDLINKNNNLSKKAKDVDLNPKLSYDHFPMKVV